MAYRDKFIFVVLAVFVAAITAAQSSTAVEPLPSMWVPASSPSFSYSGRWLAVNNGSEMRADWPCSQVRFDLSMQLKRNHAQQTDFCGNEGEMLHLPILWYGERVRVNATLASIRNASRILSTATFVGPWAEDPLTKKHISVGWLALPTGGNRSNFNFTILLRKVTTADPFGAGIGEVVFKASIFRFFGVGNPICQKAKEEEDKEKEEKAKEVTDRHQKVKTVKKRKDVTEGSIIAEIRRPPILKRRIQSIGASDTAGYCVDGTPNITGIELGLMGWAYTNCDYAFTGDLSRRFDAEISVQAISGIGLIQNADAKMPWAMGNMSMPGYFNRTLQSDAHTLWNWSGNADPFHRQEHAAPDLVLVSLGGNDYNHQHGNVPSNTSFTDAYVQFLRFLFEVAYPDSSSSIIVNVCGMGDPLEVKRDPDNNRCRPCPHVWTAFEAFQRLFPQYAGRTHFIFIPCDGTVVTGVGDIGCDGHKNRIGQGEVAEFLTPKLAKIMNW